MQSKILLLINKTLLYRVCLTFKLMTKYCGMVGRIMTLSTTIPPKKKDFCVLISGICKYVGFMENEKIQVVDGIMVAITDHQKKKFLWIISGDLIESQEFLKVGK